MLRFRDRHLDRNCGRHRTNIAPQNIPWDMICYLVAETYGGKIDDEGDFKRLTQLVHGFLNPAAYDIGHKLVEGPGDQEDLVVPTGTTLPDFMGWIQKLPEREPPHVPGSAGQCGEIAPRGTGTEHDSEPEEGDGLVGRGGAADGGVKWMMMDEARLDALLLLLLQYNTREWFETWRNVRCTMAASIPFFWLWLFLFLLHFLLRRDGWTDGWPRTVFIADTPVAILRFDEAQNRIEFLRPCSITVRTIHVIDKSFSCLLPPFLHGNSIW